MGKHKGKSKVVLKGQAQSCRSHLLVPGALVLAVLVGLVTWYSLPRRSPLSDAAQYQGGPRLALDKELIDFGTVRFERMVEARFRLRNVGDQPLRLTVNPQIEAIEGC